MGWRYLYYNIPTGKLQKDKQKHFYHPHVSYL